MEPQRYGRYSIIEQIGQGGMSVVYQARDPVLDRFVALKLLHPHLAERADSRARFAREAKAVAQLKHANIVEVFDYAPAESARSYIVTEYINGPTLREYLAETKLRSPEAAIILLQPIADALTRAHDAGIVHRDVKPENIMIRADGSPVLMDFGIAQMIDMPTLTATGTILGSPAHMAPEVIDGSYVDAPADVFSFGTVLYWAISGCLPFTGPNPSALFRRILETDFDPLSQHSETAGLELERLVTECLAKLPELRPSARQVSARLRLHLESLNLRELDKHRQDLIENREETEEALVQHTVDQLLTEAETKAVSGKLPLVLDLVNRALAHRPNDDRARRLLTTLERRQTVLGWLRWAAIVLTVLVPILALYFYFRTPVIELKQRPPSPPTAAKSKDGTQPVTSLGVVGNDKSPAPAADMGAVLETDARLDGGDSGLKAATDTGPTSMDATMTVASPPVRRPVRPRPTPNRPVTTVKKSDTPTSGSGSVLVKVKSAYLAAGVILNGDRANRLSLFEVQKNGTRMKVGKHTISIESAVCKTDTHNITLVPGQSTLSVTHSCIFKNAALYVSSDGQPLEIRDKDDRRRRLLGSTNQTINLPMSQKEIRKNLLIRVADDRFENLQVVLKAGQETRQTFKQRP